MILNHWVSNFHVFVLVLRRNLNATEMSDKVSQKQINQIFKRIPEKINQVDNFIAYISRTSNNRTKRSNRCDHKLA